MPGDRLSALHDSVLCLHILSKLPLRDAVRCSILSHRWRSLWTSLPHLKFVGADFTEEVIDNIIFLHQGDLESLEMAFSDRYWVDGDWSPDDELIHMVVLAAAVKRVKQLTLSLPISRSVPTSLYYCDHLNFLELGGFEFKLPSFFSGFSYLRTCYLTDVVIIDDTLEQLATKCPLLKKLKVISCSVRLNNLKISALSLEYFKFSDNRYEKSLTLTVNCPKLRIVKMHHCFSMLKLELNSCQELDFSTTELHVLKYVSNKNSMKKLTLCGSSTHVPSLTVLGGFSNLEDLSIRSYDLKAGSPGIGSFTLPLMANLKKVHLSVSRLDQGEISLIVFLLRNAPSLQTMTVSLPRCPKHVYEQSSLEELFGLSRASGEATIHITANTWICGRHA